MGKKSVSVETKWKVIGMKKANLSNREIGRKLGISEISVRTTLKNFNATGTVADKPRPGAPKKLSDRDENAVYRMSRLDPSESVSNITAELNETLKEVQVSRSTVSKLLRKKDLKLYHACKKPLLTPSNRIVGNGAKNIWTGRPNVGRRSFSATSRISKW
jgi:transposase